MEAVYLLLVLAILVLAWDALNRPRGTLRVVIHMLAAMVLVGLVESFVGYGPTWWPLIAAAVVGAVGLGRGIFRHAAEK